jgi:hypothetical protein
VQFIEQNSLAFALYLGTICLETSLRASPHRACSGPVLVTSTKPIRALRLTGSKTTTRIAFPNPNPPFYAPPNPFRLLCLSPTVTLSSSGAQPLTLRLFTDPETASLGVDSERKTPPRRLSFSGSSSSSSSSAGAKWPGSAPFDTASVDWSQVRRDLEDVPDDRLTAAAAVWGYTRGRASSTNQVCFLHSLLQLRENNRDIDGSLLGEAIEMRRNLNAIGVGRPDEALNLEIAATRAELAQIADGGGLTVRVFGYNGPRGALYPLCTVGSGPRQVAVLWHGPHFVPLWPHA